MRIITAGIISVPATLLMLLTALASMQLTAGETDHSHTSKYAGEQNRRIKSLSADDIAELRNGGGWGLARAAELNGVPGPLHLLEMKEAIGLSAEQISALEILYQQMNLAAREVGADLIEKEQMLEMRFQNELPDAGELQAMLDDIGKTRSELRFIHLSAHLETPDILTAEQIQQYNILRGYTRSDPCAAVPEGHNEAMWKKHNNCN